MHGKLGGLEPLYALEIDRAVLYYNITVKSNIITFDYQL